MNGDNKHKKNILSSRAPQQKPPRERKNSKKPISKENRLSQSNQTTTSSSIASTETLLKEPLEKKAKKQPSSDLSNRASSNQKNSLIPPNNRFQANMNGNTRVNLPAFEQESRRIREQLSKRKRPLKRNSSSNQIQSSSTIKSSPIKSLGASVLKAMGASPFIIEKAALLVGKTVISLTISLVTFFLILIMIMALLKGTVGVVGDILNKVMSWITVTPSYLYQTLIDEGFCVDEESCAKTEAAKFYLEFSDVARKYQETKNVNIDYKLIMGTINFSREEDEIIDNDSLEESKKIRDEINELAEAQVEDVLEKCYDEKGKVYYVPFSILSLDKYISYLKYGKSSNHPNFKGERILRECGTARSINDSFARSVGYSFYSGTHTPNVNVNTNSSDYQFTSDGTLQSQIVAYGLQFVGNPYVYGGTSLTNGIDCSAFVMRIYEHFGYSIPRTSKEQSNFGTPVNGLAYAKPGDLIFYGDAGLVSHVALYMGNNRVVHASNRKDGIKVSVANYRTPMKIKRIIS